VADCSTSVTRAGEKLEFAEMTALVDRLPTCENPMHCPHGRPTIVRLEPDDLAKEAKTIIDGLGVVSLPDLLGSGI